MNPSQSDFPASEALHNRAMKSLAGGVSTAFRMYEKPVPLAFQSAQGAELVDLDGNTYTDYVCGFGPVILGHSAPEVTAAVAEAGEKLQQVGGQHEAEIELAETVCNLVPAFERVRFALSGSEAIHAALRLARGATSRDIVVKFAGHYHGWLDGIYTATGGHTAGLPDSIGQPASSIAGVVVIEWNDIEAFRQLFDRAGDRIAAVLMEAMPCNQGVIYPAPGYLEEVREITRKAGTVLIFDEVITGFRLGCGGAQEHYGITPDLAVVAKAMGNGYPISAFGGREDLMDLVARNEVVHAGTYNGGGVSIAAARATIAALSDPEADLHSHMAALGKKLMEGLSSAGERHGHRLVTQGPGPVFFSWFLDEGDVNSYSDHLRADGAKYARFSEKLLDEGVRTIPAGRWYLTAAHTEADIDRTLEAVDQVLATLD